MQSLILFCPLGKNGRFDYTCLTYMRKDCIIKFVQSCHPDLKEYTDILKMWQKIYIKKYGWRIVTVVVEIAAI